MYGYGNCWWGITRSALVAMLRAARFEVVEGPWSTSRPFYTALVAKPLPVDPSLPPQSYFRERWRRERAARNAFPTTTGTRSCGARDRPVGGDRCREKYRAAVAIRVLHVLEAVQFGTVRHLQGVVRHVDAEHVVVVRSPDHGRYTDDPAIEQMRRDGARVHFVPMRRSPVHPLNVAAVARVHRLIRRERPDIVHGHSSIGGAVARLAAVGTGATPCYTPNGLYPGRSAMADRARAGPGHRTADRDRRRRRRSVPWRRLIADGTASP